MYDIRQFRPTLYLVLLLGLTGFSLAAEMPAMWAFSVALLGFHAWLIVSRRFRPLPRWITNIATLLALLYVIMQIWGVGRQPLMFIGQFLVLLHFIKLFEDRPDEDKKERPFVPGQLFDHANRDYTQLLILSLLLMVAASINTASLLFGLIMLAYLVSALYCCLLFHLKVEADRARKALAIPEGKISPLTLKQDQRFLTRSMRRLTGLITAWAVTAAVLVFLFFPRGPGQGVLGQLQLKGRNSLVGFSDRVSSFDQINDIKQNDEIVAHVSVWRKPEGGDEKQVQGGTLYLRGYTLDTYDIQGQGRRRPQWRASSHISIDDIHEIGDAPFSNADLRPKGEIWRQRFLLRPTGSRYLFALPGLLTYFNPDQGRTIALRTHPTLSVGYAPSDQAIKSDNILPATEYEVFSSNSPSAESSIDSAERLAYMARFKSDRLVLEQVLEYVSRPEVLGDLAVNHSRLYPITDENEEIARKIEHHLRTQFKYTLNLTDSESKFKVADDPNIVFLTRVKKGHCFYFASAMTLMCQSLNVPARMVVGFKCDEYNAVGGYFIVRQAHAHSWVEVQTPRGWVTFDPTSGREDENSHAATVWQSLKHIFDYIEYKWAEHVVAYDTRDRDNLLRALDSGMTSAAIRFGDMLRRIRDLFSPPSAGPSDPQERQLQRQESFYRVALDVLMAAVTIMIAFMVGLVIYFLIQQHRLRKRAARIGLDSLPLDDQMRFARQLAFYDQLTQALAHRGISRPRHLTHREFAQSMAFLPSEAYDTIKRLTDILYKIRFGRATLNHHRQRRLETVVQRLSQCLPVRKSAGKLF
jgi:hypothetical protein